MPINLVTWKSLFQHSLAVQIRNLIRFCEHVWDCACASLSLCVHVGVTAPACVYVCARVCVYMCVPVEVTARSQKRELHPSSSLCSLLSLPSRPVAMAAAVKAVSMAKGGSWHPPITDLPPPLFSLSPPSSTRLLTRWWTCLGVGGQWLRAAEWQWGMMRERMRKRGVTPHRWGGEMRKWKDEAKFDYYQVGVRVATMHCRKWLLFCQASFKMEVEWTVFRFWMFLGKINFLWITVFFSPFVYVCLCALSRDFKRQETGGWSSLIWVSAHVCVPKEKVRGVKVCVKGVICV